MIISQESLLFEVFKILGAKLRPEHGNKGLHKIKKTKKQISRKVLTLNIFHCFSVFFVTIVVFITYVAFFETSYQKFLLCFFKF